MCRNFGNNIFTFRFLFYWMGRNRDMVWNFLVGLGVSDVSFGGWEGVFRLENRWFWLGYC